MKKIARFICVIVLCIIVLCGITACKPYRYKGNHIELFSVAVNNIFGAYGYQVFESYDYDPFIEVLETDDYGRTLFFFTQDTGGFWGITDGGAFGTAIFIMQKSDDEFVYYYQDDCYIPHRIPKGLTSIPEDYREGLPEEQIETLKERNDWNKEINLGKCTKAVISDQAPSGKLKASKCEPIIKAYAVQNGYTGDEITMFRHDIFCNADVYGRELYYVYAIGRYVNVEGETQYFEFAVIFEPDNSCSMESICEVSSDSLDYYEKIIELKKLAHWNQPLE